MRLSRILSGGLTLVAVLLAARAGAQDLEVFSLSDFVAPSILEPLEEGDPPSKLLTVREEIGAISSYQSRTEFTDRDLLFLRLAINGYFGMWQVGTEAVAFEAHDVGFQTDEFVGDSRNAFDNGRFDIHVARYFRNTAMIKLREGEEEETRDVEVFSRLRLALEADNQLGKREVYGLSADYQMLIRDAVSSWTYTWLDGRSGERDQFYLSLTSRGVVRRYAKANLIAGFGIGAERTEGHTKFTGVRFELGVTVPLPKLRGVELQVLYAPAFQPQNRDHASGLNHELSLMVSPVVFTRLFTRQSSR